MSYCIRSKTGNLCVRRFKRLTKMVTCKSVLNGKPNYLSSGNVFIMAKELVHVMYVKSVCEHASILHMIRMPPLEEAWGIMHSCMHAPSISTVHYDSNWVISYLIPPNIYYIIKLYYRSHDHAYYVTPFIPLKIRYSVLI